MISVICSNFKTAEKGAKLALFFGLCRNRPGYPKPIAHLPMELSIESGSDLLARIKPDESDEPTPQPAKIDDTQVHVYGDTGVVIARSTYKSRGKDGRVVEIPTRYLHVWARRQGRWRLAAGSSIRIEQPKP
jgi:Domain of unknown function (DUF4440)